MAKLVGDIMAPGGKYVQNGEEKTRWNKCGALLQTDKGFRINLFALPIVPAEEGGMWLMVFEPREKASTHSNPSNPSKPQAEQDLDDIPF